MTSSDLEGGQYNHLLKGKFTATDCKTGETMDSRSYDSHFSYTFVKPLNPGTRINAKISGTCVKMWGVDEETTEKLNHWTPYRQFICDVDKLEVVE